MIITMYSNTKRTFSISGEDFYFNGKVGALCPIQKIILTNKEITITGVYKMSNLLNYIPFVYTFGKKKLTRKFDIYKDEAFCGSVLNYAHGFLQNLYVITLDNGELIKCYKCSKGSFLHVDAYRGV